MTKIPKCMSTQHPDNIHMPFFAQNSVFGGEDEIKEAYYAFSHLGCEEQMWDCEGKEVDNYVVKKLLTKYEDFFKKNKMGKDFFITLRVPNPTVEKAEAKILLETLESIPRSFDAAKLFYGEEISPVFEVILPMTSSSTCINRVYKYYHDFVIGKENIKFGNGDEKTIGKWIGEFKPKNINVIPLFEDKDSMLNAHKTVKEYLRDKKVSYQRVFLARSDPAQNYGTISALLLNKIALKNFYKLEKKIGVKIYPILGAGSAPFRGNLRPGNIKNFIEEYPSVSTYSIQSAFKYDFPPDVVKEAIKELNDREIGVPHEFDEERAKEIIERYSKVYQEQVSRLAPTINKIAKHVPKRRKRKLHISLFGYSRNLGKVTLPRTITLTASLYSIGVPPELLGLNALNDKDLKFIREVYHNFDNDLKDALYFYNEDSPFVPEEVKEAVRRIFGDFKNDKKHYERTSAVITALQNNAIEDIDEKILRAASRRNFLG